MNTMEPVNSKEFTVRQFTVRQFTVRQFTVRQFTVRQLTSNRVCGQKGDVLRKNKNAEA